MKRLPSIIKKHFKTLKKHKKNLAVIALGIILVAIPTILLLNKNKDSVGADWWSGQENGAGWAKRQRVTITNNSGVTLSSGTTVAILVDTKSLAAQGYLKEDCSDLRVVYAASSTSNTEVTRSLTYESGKTCATSAATKVYFKLQAEQNTTTTKDNTGYYVYYDNHVASNPTGTEAAFALTGATATLVCPFNGTTTCATGETNTDGTPGNIREAGSKSALSFSGFDSASFSLSENAWSTAPGLVNLPNEDMTVESWVYWEPKTDTGADVLISKRGSPAVGWRWEFSNDSNNLSFRVDCSTTDAHYRTSPDTLPYNQWTHIVTTWDAKSKVGKIYFNGVEMSYETATQCVGNYVDDSANTFYVGRDNEVNQHFPGKIDELRISNTIRYSGNFTPSTTPFTRDNLTKLLYHFDENGRLPQGSGTHFIYDDSGNNYFSVLNGGSYVEGLVGKDESDSDAGYVSGSNTYAGREGIFIEDGTTNKIPNPSFESDGYSNGWTLSGGATSPADTLAYVKFGNKAMGIVANDTTNRNLYTSITTGGGTHTLSAYVYRYTTSLAGTVDNTVAQLFFNNAAQSTTVYQNIGGGWWRLSYTGTANATDNFGVTLVENSGVIIVDGVQLEASNLVTSYTDGSLGTNYSWTGAAHNSTSSKDISGITYPVSGNISNTAGSISIWVKMPVANTTFPSSSYNQIWATQEDGSGDWLELRYDRYVNGFSFYKFLNYGSTAVTVSKTYVPNEWVHLVATWSNTSGISLRVNNGTAATNANTTMPDGFGTNIYVGGTIQQDEWHTQFTASDLRLFNAPLTATQISDLYYAGLVSQTQGAIVDRFSDDKGQDPIAIWHFDEGYGTTAHDSSKYNNDLTMASGSAPTWDFMSDPANNSLSRNIKFNGNGSYLYRNPDTDFNFGSDSFSVSGWFRHISSAPTNDQFIVSAHKNAGFKVYMKATTGVMCFGIDGDSTWSPADEACSTSSYYDSKWHQFTAVKNSTTGIYMYIDGEQVGTDTSLTANGSISNNSKLYIGIDTNGTGGTWYGNLDELQFYRYALSDEQIRTNTIGSQTALKLGSMQEDTISEGLVGYWKMDEGTWNGSAGEILDYSGNGNIGFASGSTASNGKFGFGGVQNSSSDYINLGSRGSLDNLPSWTYALWVYPTSFGSADILMTKSQGSTSNAVRMYIYSTNGDVIANMGQSGTDTSARTSTYLPLNTWTHVAATYDKTENKMRIYFNGEEQPYASNVQSADTLSPFNDALYDFTIGNRIPTSDEAFIGSYDEARVYNRALSERELQTLAKWEPGPTAYWKLDEPNWVNDCSTQTVMDSSGNGYHGTSCPNGTGLTKGKQGKFGNAAFLENNKTLRTGAYAPTMWGTGTNSFTISAWVKPETQIASFYDNPTIFGAQATVGGCQTGAGFTAQFTDATSGTFYFRMPHEAADLCSGATNLEDPNPMEFNEWHHYTGTFNGETGEMILYKDGAEVASTSWGGIAAITWTSTGRIDINQGIFSDYFEGGIDDVKIYNYVRTPAQVVEDMNAGHPTPGSPVGSAIAYWSFDEGHGDYAYDESANQNTVWLAGGDVCPGDAQCPNWSLDGKIGKALTFDGGDFAECTEDTIFDIYGSDPVSVSTWVKTSTKPTTSSYFGVVGFADSYSTGGQDKYIQIDSNGLPNFYTWDGSAEKHAVGTTDVTDGNWHHLVGVFTGTQSQIYVDGKLEGTVSTTSTDNINNPQIIFSQYSSAAPTYYELYVGSVDETRIYNQALSSDQIKTEYNLGKALVFGSGNVNSAGVVSNSAADQYCPPGESITCVPPILHLPFDENQGTSNYDNASGAYTAAFAGSVPIKWEQNCIQGSCITTTTGNSEYQKTEIADTDDSLDFEANEDFSFSFFIKAKDNINENAMQIYNGGGGGEPGYQFRANNSLYACAFRDALTEDLVSSNVNYKDGTWRHIACVMDRDGSETGLAGYHLFVNGVLTASDTSLAATTLGATYDAPFSVGNYSASRELGSSIDDLRVYDYARSPRQIAWDYNKGEPFLRYSFEECTGTTLYNTARGLKGSNLGLNGTLNITATLPGAGTGNSSAGTCDSGTSTHAWYNGADGKFGSSVYLDAIDEYITVADNNAFSFGNGTSDRQFSFSTWIYTNSDETTGGDIISKHNASDIEYRFYTTSDEAICLVLNDDSVPGTLQKCTPNGVIVLGTWQHVVATYNATEALDGINIYVNSELQSVGSTTSVGYTAMENMSVGVTIMGRFVASVSNEYQGKIDEVQMYNYELTPMQIKNIYNNRAAVNFE